MSDSNKMVIVVGAGASNDCDNGSGPVENTRRPPLARELFKNTAVVHEHLNKHPRARNIQSTQTDLTRAADSDDAFDLEQRLLEIASDTTLAHNFVGVPLFLRSYLADCSDHFLNGRVEVYGRLVSELLIAGREVAYVSLNYDTLLEQAIEQMTLRHGGFAAIPDYQVKRPLLLKPHGSIDWAWIFPRRQNDTADLFLDRLARTDLEHRVRNAFLAKFDFKAAGEDLARTNFMEPGADMIVRTRGSNGEGFEPAWAYPALTAPLAEKTDQDILAPRPHRESLREFQRDCPTYVFIGTSGFDRHVIEMLGKGCEPAINLWLVNKGSRDQLDEQSGRIEDGLRGGRPDQQLHVLQRNFHFDRVQEIR